MFILKRTLGASTFLLLSFALHAALPPCSIHPPKGASQVELLALCKVPEADARVAALAAVKADKMVVVKSSELEVEQGCLVWSYDIKVTDKKGIQEVFIDAGNGQILSQSHESERQERAEQKEDTKGQPKP
jgi:hypothetical protein